VIIVQTPLRVSFLGGGTDFPEFFCENGGAVLGSSIDKYIYHTISQFPSWLFDHNIRFSYRKVEQVKSLDEIEHVPFREILKKHGLTKDIEVNLASDLPSFTGLGSSSSFTVGLIKGLLAQKGEFISQKELAVASIKMERETLGESVGLQDQIFAAYGGLNVIRFNGLNDFHVERLQVSQEVREQFNNNLIMIFTGKTRRANEIEKTKIRNIKNIHTQLKQIHSLVDEGLSCLNMGKDLDGFGKLLHENWVLKKTLSSSVSDDYIDDMYRLGLNNGALGGKILGAGGGGFLLFYVPLEKQPVFRKAFERLHEVKIKLNAQGSAVIHS
jgi:D-glycero-alpha-D-manno-heptose-7-phosphate kinase